MEEETSDQEVGDVILHSLPIYSSSAIHIAAFACTLVLSLMLAC
jgi:hypothetical protein